jgi:hypothetical protein
MTDDAEATDANGTDVSDELTRAEERRAEEEALIEQRNAAQHAAERDGSAEQVLLLPPEGYAVAPGDEQPGEGEAPGG